jgi:hypothetical protein
MNASRLREIVDLLLSREGESEIQVRLQELHTALADLVSQPQNTTHQTNFAQALSRLGVAATAVRATFEPAQIPLLEEIGADKYFLHDFAAEIAGWIQENPLSPAVARDKLTEFVNQRAQYLARITQLRDNLETLNIRASTLQPGDAEIGFLLPRTLFNNRLDPLIKELRDVNRIIRAFSEAALGRPEEVELREISTSDPLFFFHLDPLTIAKLGVAVAWALKTWKQVEEIRHVRAVTRRTNVLTEKEAGEIFDKKIHERIEAAIESKLDELAPKDDGTPGRAKEQRIDLKWALESILAHVERGMIVEVRFVPPPEKAAETATAGAAATQTAFGTLQNIAPQLAFPKMEGAPILKLPQPPPASDPRND